MSSLIKKHLDTQFNSTLHSHGTEVISHLWSHGVSTCARCRLKGFPRCNLDYSPVENHSSQDGCIRVSMSLFYTPSASSRFTVSCCSLSLWKGVCDSTSRAEPIIVNRPISNFTQRVSKASTLYMQSRGTLLKKLAPSDYICNLISLVTQW